MVTFSALCMAALRFFVEYKAIRPELKIAEANLPGQNSIDSALRFGGVIGACNYFDILSLIEFMSCSSSDLFRKLFLGMI